MDIQVLISDKLLLRAEIIEKEPMIINLLEKGDKGDPLSTPPVGYFPVRNLYVNNQGKLVVLYDDGQ
jgi:hypothetical protein